MAITWDRTSMWHPEFAESRQDTAGLFVHLRREFVIDDDPPLSLRIQITADTKYRLYVNRHFITSGPVKGDHNLWFLDDVGIAPYLITGRNIIAVVILRFFYATPYAASFPRLPSGGLRIVLAQDRRRPSIESSTSWKTAMDTTTLLRIDQPDDHFLRVYESTVRPVVRLCQPGVIIKAYYKVRLVSGHLFGLVVWLIVCPDARRAARVQELDW
ncbi:hypothetical protein BJY00DRAFT_310229 [Aspergillus carlsbadensis]|nr:hypothetical protein BJY00DRAFT_310229 [Aspergillus carlsbadensis]